MTSVMTPPGTKAPETYIEQVMSSVKAKNPAEPEFHQAVAEVFDSLRLVLAKHPEYQSSRLLERIVEPERVLMFRVPWFDDQGNIQVNRGFRIEMNSAIGLGGREIGFLFGQYKRLRNEFTGVLTGKGLGWGGSLIRPEATGYGCVYFAAEMLKSKKDSFDGKLCLVSGSGNVSQYTVEKLLDFGAKPVTVSDSHGVIYDPDGIDRDKLAYIMELKNFKRGRIRDYADKFKKAIFMPTDIKLEHNPQWNIKADCAFPSATQNEITAKDAANLLKNGCKLVAEGANMPSTLEATKMFLDAKVLYGPAKAANAGGVATSGLEMAQNSARLCWTREEVDDRLHKIMIAIHQNCFETAEKYGTPGNLVNGANIAGFLKVANSMLDQGLV